MDNDNMSKQQRNYPKHLRACLCKPLIGVQNFELLDNEEISVYMQKCGPNSQRFDSTRDHIWATKSGRVLNQSFSSFNSNKVIETNHQPDQANKSFDEDMGIFCGSPSDGK